MHLNFRKIICLLGIFLFQYTVLAKQDSLEVYREILAIRDDASTTIAFKKGSVKKYVNRFEKDGSPFLLACAYSAFGNFYERESKYDSAKYFIEKALDIRIKHNYAAYEASSYEQIAGVYDKIDEDSLALRYLYKSLHIKEKLGIPRYLISLYQDLGNVYFDFEMYDSSILYFNKSLKICETLELPSSIAALYNNIGNVHYYQDHNEEAIEYYKKSVRWYLKAGEPASTQSGLYNIGAVYLELKNYSEALAYFNKSISLNKKYASFDSYGHLFPTLIEAHTYIGNTDSVLYYLDSYIHFRDSIFQKDKIAAALELETKYKTQEKEQALLIEKEKNDAKRKTIIYLIIIVVILVLSIFFISRFYLQKRKFNKAKIEIKNQEIDHLIKSQEAKTYAALIEGQSFERQRIAQDLHDRIGGTLAAVKVHFNNMNHKLENLKAKNFQMFDKMSGMLEEAVADVRSISHDLTSGKISKLGLKGALIDLSNTISQAKNIQFDLAISEDLQIEDEKVTQEIYSVVQELTSNTLKHANANYIELNINKYEDHISLVYEDNGIGFVFSNAQKKGLGLSGIEKRIKTLNGNINFDSALGRGTIVIINIPT